MRFAIAGLVCVLGSLPAQAGDTAPLRVLVGSCYDQSAPDGTWEALNALAPDVYIAAGDNIYADVVLDGGRATFVGDPERVRAAYATLRDDRAFARFRAAVPVLPTWDDHDYGLNDAGADLPFASESERLFLDFWQVPADDPRRTRPGVYTADVRTVGDLRVQTIVLDTRRFRSPLVRTPSGTRGVGPYLPDPDPSKTLLGSDQWTWLEAQLRAPADVRLIVTSIQLIADAHRHERWGALPHERARLLRLLRDTDARGVVLLSGDRHFGSLYRLDPGPDGPPYALWELTSSSLNKSFGGLPTEDPRHRVGPQVADENVGLVTIDPTARTVRLALLAKDGAVRLDTALPLADLAPKPGL